MPSSCTFANIPFLLPTKESEELFNLRLPLEQFRINVSERTWPGPQDIGITYPLRYPKRPELKLNEFFYPTHITRWGEFNGLVDQDGYKKIKAACFYPGPNPQDFIMSQTDDVSGATQSITTQMYCLPPKPVVNADGKSGMYLITLVDQRYYLQHQTAGTSLPLSSWDSLLAYASAAIGISMSYDATPGAYGSPNAHSAMLTNYDNAAVLLDAIAWNTGRVIVRNLDGTYYAQNATTATGQLNFTLNLLAGGNAASQTLTNDGIANYALNSVLPDSVTVTFPYYNVCASSSSSPYKNPDKDHLPFARTAGDVYPVVVPLGTALSGTTYTGFSGTKVFHTTAEAYINSAAATAPTNLAAMNDLAMQVAKDYYSWQINGLDETAPGIFPWRTEGYNDLTWVWTREKTFTRIQRKPWNFMVEEFNHHLVAPACPPNGSSSSSGSSSSGFSSSSSSGITNCIGICAASDGTPQYMRIVMVDGAAMMQITSTPCSPSSSSGGILGFAESDIRYADTNGFGNYFESVIPDSLYVTMMPNESKPETYVLWSMMNSSSFQLVKDEDGNFTGSFTVGDENYNLKFDSTEVIININTTIYKQKSMAWSPFDAVFEIEINGSKLIASVTE